MANETKTELRSKMIYQVFVRNHSSTGDFQGLIQDLPRIRSLGVDYLYVMPIHPISVKNRKGTLGSSYAIADYYGINPEYGDLRDFQALVKEIHNNGMKLWLDVVFNHTGADHFWLVSNPEYYYRDRDNNFGDKVGAWLDVYDLNFGNEQLQKELVEVLCYIGTS